MKQRITEFTSQRNEVLLRNFRASLASQSQFSRIRAFHEAKEAPAPRFWVSEARATRIIIRMLNGEDVTKDMYEEKARMYHEIFRRVKAIKDKNPQLPVGDIVFDVVNSRAPSSYLSLDRAMKIIYNARKS